MKTTFSFAIFDNIIKDFYFAWKFKGKNYPRPPQYPNSISTQKYKNPEFSKSRIITFTTTDNLETVYNFYKKRLLKNGWELDEQFELPVDTIKFLFRHPRWHVHRPSFRRKSFHDGLRPWFSLYFTAKQLDNLLQVEIEYRILGPFGWWDDNF